MFSKLGRLISYVINREPSARSPFYAQRLQVFRVFDGHEPKGKDAVLFIGDSMIQSFEWAEYFSDLDSALVINRGISGDTVEGLAERIEAAFASCPLPNKVFIMVGANDLGMTRVFHVERFIRRYADVIEKALRFVPREAIYVHSILPADRRNISNADVKTANQRLMRLAEAKGIQFINIFDSFVDSNGILRRELLHDDGLHLSAEGYTEWLKILEPLVRSKIKTAV